MKKNYFSILLILIPFLLQAQVLQTVPCNERLVRSVDFSYTGSGPTPERWSLNNITGNGITVSTSASYLPTGAFSTVKMDGQGGATPYNTVRQYAIVENPGILNNVQYANIAAPNGMMVINTRQDGSVDEFAKFSVTGLKPGITYYIEVKLWNVLDFDGRTVYNNNNPGSWNPLLMAACKANAGDLWDGNDNNSTWTGKVAPAGSWSSIAANHTRWEMNDGVVGRMLVPTTGGTYAILNGKKELRNNATGFDIVLSRRGDGVAHSVVFGIEYVKVYACEEEAAINISGNSYTVCEGQEYELTATGLNPPGTDEIVWTGPDGIPQTGASTLTVSAPAGAGTTAVYTAEGQWAKATVTLTSKMCCFAYGRNSVIFEETFTPEGTYPADPLGWASGTECGNPLWANIPKLGDKTWISDNYIYAGDDPGSGCNVVRDAGGAPTGYAVVRSSRHAGADVWGTWYDEIIDHTTGTNHSSSGFLAINAGEANVSGNDYLYRLKLDHLCPNTTYEFSAWYASMAATAEAKVNLTFEIRDKNDNLVVPAVNTGDVLDFKWHETKIAFTTPASIGNDDEYFFQLLNTSIGWGDAWGNDIAIDDITVSKCMPSVGVYSGDPSVTELNSCTNDEVEIQTDKTIDELAVMIGGGSVNNVYIQWYRSEDSTLPLSGWTLIGDADDLSFNAEPEGNTYYYCAKISSDEGRAKNNLDPERTECGNDVVTSFFKLTLSGKPNIAGDNDVTICEGKRIAVRGTTTESSANIKWGWTKGNETDFISGYELSSTNSKKQFVKTDAQPADGGDYYFIVSNGDCRASKEITVTVENCTTKSDLYLTLSNDAGLNASLCFEDEVIYTLTLLNDGGKAEDNVQVMFTLPQEFEFVSASPSAGFENNLWTAGQMDAGESKTMEIRAKAVSMGTLINHQAYISQAGTELYGSYDDAPGNYRSETVVDNVKEPFTVSLSVDKNSVYTGETVTFTAIPTPDDRVFAYDWQNNGSQIADNEYELQLFDSKVVQVTVSDGVCSSVTSSVEVDVNWPNAILHDRRHDAVGNFMTDVDFNFKLHVFNRFGSLIYEGGNGWDGTFNRHCP